MLSKLFPSVYKVSNLESDLKDYKQEVERLENLVRSERNRREEDLVSFRNQLNEKDRQHEAALKFVTESSRVDRMTAKADARKEVEAELENAKQIASAAEARAAAFEAANVELQNSLTAHVAQVTAFRGVIDLLAGKLPNVDLSKFNVNVDIAPAEVNVIGGQAQQKKS